MKKFILKDQEQRDKLLQLISSGLVGGIMQHKEPPKYFLYLPVSRRVRELSEFLYRHAFTEAECLQFEDIVELLEA